MYPCNLVNSFSPSIKVTRSALASFAARKIFNLSFSERANFSARYSEILTIRSVFCSKLPNFAWKVTSLNFSTKFSKGCLVSSLKKNVASSRRALITFSLPSLIKSENLGSPFEMKTNLFVNFPFFRTAKYF